MAKKSEYVINAKISALFTSLTPSQIKAKKSLLKKDISDAVNTIMLQYLPQIEKDVIHTLSVMQYNTTHYTCGDVVVDDDVVVAIDSAKDADKGFKDLHDKLYAILSGEFENSSEFGTILNQWLNTLVSVATQSGGVGSSAYLAVCQSACNAVNTYANENGIANVPSYQDYEYLTIERIEKKQSESASRKQEKLNKFALIQSTCNK